MAARLDGGERDLEDRMRFLFARKVAFKDFTDIVSEIELAEVLQVRKAVEKQDARDQEIGVLHLVDRLVVFVLFGPLEPPVSEHARVQEILVDRGQLIFQTEVEKFKDLRITTHV